MLVGSGGGNDGDLHAAQLIDLVVLDLREHQLILEAQGVVPATIERVGGNAAKIPAAISQNGAVV